MRKRLGIAAATMGIGLLAVGTIYYISRPKKPVFVTDAQILERIEKEMTPPTKQDVHTGIQPILLEEIVLETTKFSQFETNTDESRRCYCVDLFKEAGYDPTITDDAIYVVKKGRSPDYVAIGAHYDKVEGPSKGILDNMLGCILVSNIAEVLKDEPTNFTYLFLSYGDEEIGRKIGSATSAYRSGPDGRPTFVIEIDYVGDKRSSLGGRYLSPINGRYLKRGIKINTYPTPEPPTIHTERDNISNVDFDKTYLAYKTVISIIEGIEKGDGLNPPDTVNFWRKDKPLRGVEVPQMISDREKDK